MTKVTGIGGIFFKARDPDKLRDWYQRYLGFESDGHHGATFEWRHSDQPDRPGKTIWSPFPQDTGYFNPSEKPFMINYRVANLDALLADLRNGGVAVEDRIEEYEYGRFAWIMDPDGNRIELWEPAEGW